MSDKTMHGRNYIFKATLSMYAANGSYFFLLTTCNKSALKRRPTCETVLKKKKNWISVFGRVIRSFRIHASFFSFFFYKIFFLIVKLFFQLKLGIYNSEEHLVSWIHGRKGICVHHCTQTRNTYIYIYIYNWHKPLYTFCSHTQVRLCTRN